MWLHLHRTGNWGQRNYGVDGQLGLEETPEGHIDKLVKVFREVRRVLRDDGCLFLNYGDKYAGGGCGGGGKQDTNVGSLSARTAKIKNLPDGNLIGLAWRLAFALQADGWILRSDIIWAKATSLKENICPYCGKDLSFQLSSDTDLLGEDVKGKKINHVKTGSTMPESLNGWRWEQHKVKVKVGNEDSIAKEMAKTGKPRHSVINASGGTEYKPCPGCPKCEPNGGLVLRKGSWRPTRAHEYLFMLTKTNNYFCDIDAVREAQSQSEVAISRYKYKPSKPSGRTDGISRPSNEGVNDYYVNPSGRNLRDVWTINPQAFPESHYATFPEKLVEPCIKVATSEKGCCPAMIKKLKIREGLTKEEHEKVMQFLTRKGLV